MNKTRVIFGLRLWLLFYALSGVAQAEVYLLPPADEHLIGSQVSVLAMREDTLVDIARRHGLGYTDIVTANPTVDPWLPGEGTEVLLPTSFILPDAPREGIVLNLPEYRLYYYPKPKPGESAVVHTFPISIGRMDWETPLGLTKVTAKAVKPAWYPPESIRKEHAEAGDPLPRIVPAGPDNPLGDYAMRLGLPGYLIHGTNRPAGVGMRVTHGCIRMFPEDIEVLFAKISVNTPVRIINQPTKFGWQGDRLYLEAHAVLDVALPPQVAELIEGKAVSKPENGLFAGDVVVDIEPVVPTTPGALTLLTRSYVEATSKRDVAPDWTLMEQLLERADGMPYAVAQQLLEVSPVEAGESELIVQLD